MTTRLVPVGRDDVRPLIALNVAPEQAMFVAPNAVTLAEAPYETGAHVFGIWSDDTRVGLLAVVDNRDYAFGGPDDDPNSAFLWRLMVAAGYQGRGHGRAALRAMFDWVRARGLSRVFTSVEPGNAGAIVLYQSLGFAMTGRVIEGELEMHLDLQG